MNPGQYSEIDRLGNELVKCNFDCEGITNNPKKGVLPRSLLPEERCGETRCIVVGLNPGRCKSAEKRFYLEHDLSYDSTKEYFFQRGLKDKPYFKRTREIVSLLGYEGDILWTDLVKCECSGKNGVLPVQTLRVCINRFLRREIELFDAQMIFALGNDAFKFCALSFPNHLVVGVPHPTGSYGNFDKLKKKISRHPSYYTEQLSKPKDKNGKFIAVKLSKIKP
jgi:hypothetical protein